MGGHFEFLTTYFSCTAAQGRGGGILTIFRWWYAYNYFIYYL